MTIAFASVGAFAAHLRRSSMGIRAAEHHGLERGAAIIEAEAKALIGTEYEGWAPLAETTVAEKQRLGFANRVSATDPLLREGTMRESISHVVDARRAVIGSDDPVAIYQETGTSRIPARSFLGSAAFRKGEEAAKVLGKAIANAIVGRRPG